MLRSVLEDRIDQMAKATAAPIGIPKALMPDIIQGYFPHIPSHIPHLDRRATPLAGQSANDIGKGLVTAP